MHRMENRVKCLAGIRHLVLPKERFPALGEHRERLPQRRGRDRIRGLRVQWYVRVGIGVRLVHGAKDVAERGGHLGVGILAPV